MAAQALGYTTGRAGIWAVMLAGLSMAISGCTPTGTAASSVADGTPQSEGVLNVADAAIAGNNPQMALKMSQAVLANDPRNLQALYHEAAAYYVVGRCQDSIAAYKVALTIDPRSSQAQAGIGRCMLKRNAAEAEIAFTAAVQDDPGNAAAWNDLGISRDLQGKYAAARAPYEKSLLLSPGQLATEVNLGMSLALSGDAGDALLYLGPLPGATAMPARCWRSIWRPTRSTGTVGAAGAGGGAVTGAGANISVLNTSISRSTSSGARSTASTWRASPSRPAATRAAA
jgi:Flp pilus assembly protein TadD